MLAVRSTAKVIGLPRVLRSLWWVQLLSVLTLGTLLDRPAAAEPPSLPTKGSTSQAARDNAVQAIPLRQLDAPTQALVQEVLGNVTIYRRMPVRVIQCDPDLYLFLTEHPDVVVDIWQVLRLSQISLKQLDADSYQIIDAAGTNGTIRFLHRSFDTHLMYVEGTYEGPMSVKPVHGRGILLLKSGYVREADGRYYVTCRLDTFMQVEPGGAELLTKTFQPLVGKIADLNFTQTAAFVGSLSKTAEVNTLGVQRLASRLNGVQPEVRQQFAELAEQVADRAAELAATPASHEEPIAQRPLPAGRSLMR